MESSTSTNSSSTTQIVEQLKLGIYNQLYAASMYREIAKMTDNIEEKTFLLNFAVSLENNVSYMDRYYQFLMTSSYNPLIEQPKITGSYQDMLLHMVKYEGESHYGFTAAAYDPLAPDEYHNMMEYILGTSNTRALLLLYMYLHNGS
ncbi:MAG: hypothetical protein ACK5LC_04035 [Coprobacillaceae bacterium]